MLDVRVYRAAFLPALVALFIAAFSLVDRPPPATSDQSAEAFDSGRAFGSSRPPARNSLLELARTFPGRAPGSSGDLGLSDRVARALAAVDPATRRPLFQVTRRGSEGGARDTGELETVVGVRPGLSSRRVVVVAHRDSAARPGLAELSATAALLELARDVRARELRKTLVLVSTSGGSTGFAGARAWARGTDAGQVDAVIVLGDLAGTVQRRPWVVPWTGSSAPPPLVLQRTVENAARREVGSQPGGARAAAQWIRRAVPVTVSEQGVIAEAGLPAVLLGVSGERGPAPAAAATRARMRQFGRAALRAVLAADAAGDGHSGLEQGPKGIVTMRNVLPDWAVRLVIGTLLLPAVLVGLDAFFRVRRRRVPTGPWFLWLAGPAAAVVAGWLWLRLLGLVGAIDAPPSPVALQVLRPTGGGLAVIGSALLVGALTWVGLRAVLRGRGERTAGARPAAGGLAAASGLVLVIGAALAWADNPYLAALLLPATHLWLFAAAPGGRMQGRAALPAVLVGLLGPLLVLLYYVLALSAGPLDLAWLLGLATAGGNVSIPALLVAAAYLAVLVAVVRIVVSQRRVEKSAPPDPISTRGPLTYAGPGSLGGTESALRR